MLESRDLVAVTCEPTNLGTPAKTSQCPENHFQNIFKVMMLAFTRIIWHKRVTIPSLPLLKSFSTNSRILQRQQDGDTPRKQDDKPQDDKPQEPQKSKDDQSHKSKSKPQSDEETRERLEQMLGSDGGLAGVELEGGKAVGLKRHVKGNMFRYI